MAESLKKSSNFLGVHESPPLRTRSSSVASDRPSLLKMHHRSSSVSSLLSIEPQYPTDDILTQKLSAAEIEVLKCTSSVNEKMFLPWIDETDLKEQFSYETKYLDPEGSLRLSEKQIEKFGGWRRPADIMKYPQLICLISRYTKYRIKLV
jgi:calpain-7